VEHLDDEDEEEIPVAHGFAKASGEEMKERKILKVQRFAIN
jgi:hypothetical protein